MRVPSHGTAHRLRTGAGEAKLTFVLVVAIGLIAQAAQGQTSWPDRHYPPLQFESMAPRADRERDPVIRDYVAEVLANPPQQVMDTESPDAAAGPRYHLFHAAEEQQNAQRQAVRQFYDHLGANGTAEAGKEVWTFRDEAMNFTYTPPDASWIYRTDGPSPEARMMLLHVGAPE